MHMDRYYRNLLDRTDMETVVKAGWIDEGLDRPLDEGLEFYTTPLDAITRGGEKEAAVLFYMGCFAPIHEGHMTVMRLAKETVEEKTGLPVVAGYFAPDHDDYVGTKTGDDPAYFGAERINIIQQQEGFEEWMQVDVWPALYAPTALNFTTIYDRFINYLNQWLPSEMHVRVFCVFGGDNYQFGNAFLDYGHGVCVPRQGVEPDMTAALPNDRVIWSDKSSNDHSSTKARAALKAAQVEQENTTSDGKAYILRDDLTIAFKETPSALTRKAISQIVPILLSKHVGRSVVPVDVQEQVIRFRSMRPFISLDCFLPAKHRLELTRVFVAGDMQKYSKHHTNRVGTPSVPEQLEALPLGTYDLVDDDIASGATMHMVSSLLAQRGIEVGEFKSLLDVFGDGIYDVLDMRDFVLGSKHGGLTVKTPSGGMTRALYAAPYVNLVTRAKMNPVSALRLSMDVWKLNRDIYRGSGITVGDISDRQDFTQFGFSPDVLVEDLCAQHVALLAKAFPNAEKKAA